MKNTSYCVLDISARVTDILTVIVLSVMLAHMGESFLVEISTFWSGLPLLYVLKSRLIHFF